MPFWAIWVVAPMPTTVFPVSVTFGPGMRFPTPVAMIPFLPNEQLRNKQKLKRIVPNRKRT